MTVSPNRPNIFEFAKKELTMDAMVAWFLECCNSKSKYRVLGIDFVNSFIFERPHKEVKIIDCKTQYNRIDVFAIIFSDNKYYPIIFEDKVDSFLRQQRQGQQGQLNEYCKMVFDWVDTEIKARNNKKIVGSSRSDILKDVGAGQPCEWGEIYYIYFNTGFINNGERQEIENQKNKLISKTKYKSKIIVNIRDRKAIYDFITRHDYIMGDDFLYKDYSEYIRNKYVEMEEQLNNWNSYGKDSAKRFDSLSYYPGQHTVFEHIFDEAIKCSPVTSFGGLTFLKCEIKLHKITGVRENDRTEKKKILYQLYFKKTKENKREYITIGFKQYRDESKNKNINQERQKEYEKVFRFVDSITQKLLKDDKHILLNKAFKMKCNDKKYLGQDSKDFFEIRLYDNIPTDLVCHFLQELFSSLSNKSTLRLFLM